PQAGRVTADEDDVGAGVGDRECHLSPQPAAAAGDEKTLSRQLESVEDAHRSARLRWGDHHAGMFINLPAERSARWKITPPPRGLRTARRTSPGSPAIYHAPGPPDAPAKNLPRI